MPLLTAISRRPNKRVHFSENCLTFAPITSFPLSPSESPPPHILLRTPSPSDDDEEDDDSSSSPDPPTPPPVQYIPSPYPYASASLTAMAVSSLSNTPIPSNGYGLPTPTPSPPHHHHHPVHMNVHHLLAYSPSTLSPLLYNLTTLPNVQTLSALAQRPVFELDEPATNPPLGIMILTCGDLPEDWRVRVTPTSVSRRTELALAGNTGGLFSPASSVFSPQLAGAVLLSPDMGAGATAVGTGGLGYVTVLDVLLALYTSLRMIVHPSEYEQLTTRSSSAGTGPTKESVNAAFWARVAQVGDPAKKEEQRRKGVRRVDFLGKKTRLFGLTGTLKSEVWELELGDAVSMAPAAPHMRTASSSSSSSSGSA